MNNETYRLLNQLIYEFWNRLDQRICFALSTSTTPVTASSFINGKHSITPDDSLKNKKRSQLKMEMVTYFNYWFGLGGLKAVHVGEHCMVKSFFC